LSTFWRQIFFGFALPIVLPRTHISHKIASSFQALLGVDMKSNLENVSPLERKLNIEVPAAEVQAAFDRAFKGIQKNVAIKGFRKGKAPMTTVKAIYQDRVKQDVIQDIIQNNYASALQEHKLDPISYPTIEFDPVEDAKDFQFSAEFEVRPSVSLNKVEGLPVKKEKFEVNDKTISDTLEEIRKSRSEMTAVTEDRGAQSGDTAIIDFEGMVDGKPLENGKAEGHGLELGSNSFIPGFEEGVIGMKAGSTKTIELSFPEGYHVAELAGRPVHFNVALKELKSKILPEINDEFAKGMGPYENLDGLKTAIREDVLKREEKRIADDLKNRLMKVLVEHNPVQVPKTLMVEQKKALIEDFKKRTEQQGMNAEQFEEYKSKWDSDFEQTAAFMIQSSFLIDKIALENNIKATPADIDLKLKEYAAQTGIDMKRILEFYSEDDRRSRLAYQVTEEKVVDFLLSKAQVQEVSKDEITKDEPAAT
jgi:trigger factor